MGPSDHEKLEEIMINHIIEELRQHSEESQQLTYKIHEKVWFPVWGQVTMKSLRRS